MLLRRLVTALSIAILLAPCLEQPGQGGRVPLSEVKAGLRGVGRSVFQATRWRSSSRNSRRYEERHGTETGRHPGAVVQQFRGKDRRGGRHERQSRLHRWQAAGGRSAFFSLSKEPLAASLPLSKCWRVSRHPAELAGRDSRDHPGFSPRASIRTFFRQRPANPRRRSRSQLGEASAWCRGRGLVCGASPTLELRWFFRGVIEVYAPLFRRMGLSSPKGGPCGRKDADVPMGNPFPDR